MPRRARLSIPGIPWHIIQRGNNRAACFYAEEDYHRYLRTLKEQSEAHGCQVHAYVLMTNHVHLLVTPEREDSAALMMKHLGQRYVQYVNRTYRRTGTLWEGRFRSCPAQSETYVLACYRYIELNPVRAGMVEHPGEYPWSSFGVNGQGRPDPLVTPHSQYRALGRDDRARRRAYRALFRAHMEPALIDEIRLATNSNYALGNEGFKQEIERMLNCRATPGRPGRPRKEQT
ncbi:MAG: transposase [Gammaproteobacteria bacterium]|nr:transposase [Gammaproteobacteria bacterium]NIR98368.1 transposase [Gammaproteobacteria bacterium]NIT64122.1 transposase [Gammaproteobacteria bacterium]NIV21059.1 transposase [Gammaproteobacteria bacterium]NIY32702.1 transposase [Gammaproteobacteria bacterium]